MLRAEEFGGADIENLTPETGSYICGCCWMIVSCQPACALFRRIVRMRLRSARRSLRPRVAIFLRDVRPLYLGVVPEFAFSAKAQQFSLARRPKHKVLVVNIVVHRSRMSPTVRFAGSTLLPPPRCPERAHRPLPRRSASARPLI